MVLLISLCLDVRANLVFFSGDSDLAAPFRLSIIHVVLLVSKFPVNAMIDLSSPAHPGAELALQVIGPLCDESE